MTAPLFGVYSQHGDHLGGLTADHAEAMRWAQQRADRLLGVDLHPSPGRRLPPAYDRAGGLSLLLRVRVVRGEIPRRLAEDRGTPRRGTLAHESRARSGFLIRRHGGHGRRAKPSAAWSGGCRRRAGILRIPGRVARAGWDARETGRPARSRLVGVLGVTSPSGCYSHDGPSGGGSGADQRRQRRLGFPLHGCSAEPARHLRGSRRGFSFPYEVTR